MKILYLSFPGGGVDTSLQILGSELKRRGHDVSILYVLTSKENLSTSKLPAHFMKLGNFHYYLSRMLMGHSRLPALLKIYETAAAIRLFLRNLPRDQRPDLIEIPEIFMSRYFTDGIPYVVRLHSADWTWREQLQEKIYLEHHVDRYLEKITLAGAAGISTPNQSLAQFVFSRCVIRREVEFIPYGIDISRFKPGLRNKDPLVLFVGRIEKRKGADVLLDAVPAILRKIPDCRFVFIGNICPDMKESVSRYKDVEFLGSVHHDDLPGWYRRAAVLAVPSRWDNSPNTVYEGMACGTPVVASETGGIPELLHHEKEGILVPPGDSQALANAIVRLLENADLYESIVNAALERVAKTYEVGNIAMQTAAFYEQVLRK